MKLTSIDKIMLNIEGPNGKCFVQFDGGYPTVWCGGGATGTIMMVN